MEKDFETLKGNQGSDPEDTERPSDVEKGQPQLTTMVTSHPSIEPLVEVREDTEVESMGGSSVLITSAVEIDNTIVSFGDYSFHRKCKAMIKKKTNKSEEVVIWTPQGENPEQRAI